MFSRGIRWPVLRRRATASGRFSSSVSAWRSMLLPQIVADVIQIQRSTSAVSAPPATSACSMKTMGKPSRTTSLGRHRDAADDAAVRGGDDVLHLHRLDDRDLLALPHLVADGDVDRNDRALDRRGNAERAVGAGEVRGFVILDDGSLLRLRSAASWANSASGSRLLTRAPAKPPSPCRPGAPVRRSGAFAPRSLPERRDVRRPSACGRRPQRNRDAPRMACRKRNVGADTLQPELARARATARHRGGEVRRRRVRDHLGEQRVERAAGAIPGIAEAIGPHARTARRLIDASACRRRAARNHPAPIVSMLTRAWIA